MSGEVVFPGTATVPALATKALALYRDIDNPHGIAGALSLLDEIARWHDDTACVSRVDYDLSPLVDSGWELLVDDRRVDDRRVDDRRG